MASQGVACIMKEHPFRDGGPGTKKSRAEKYERISTLIECIYVRLRRYRFFFLFSS